MRIALLAPDGHNAYPNFALMRTSAYLKRQGHHVEWAQPGEHYDELWVSKVFTFTPDVDWTLYHADRIFKGGTGYDIHGHLPPPIEASTAMDYTLYPHYDGSLQFYSRGCIRHCPFCLVRDKEGYIQPVTPVDLNPNGQYIEVLDNNFFANPRWHEAVDDILRIGQPVKLHGVDVRIMDDAQAQALNSMRHVGAIHIAWDLPQMDLRPQLEAMIRHVKPYKIMCYVLIGYNSTIEQDLFRIRTLKQYGISPFVQPYRDYENHRIPRQYEKDLARWADNKQFFKAMDFADFEPRHGFRCQSYLDNPDLLLLPSRKETAQARRLQAQAMQLRLELPS